MAEVNEAELDTLLIGGNSSTEGTNGTSGTSVQTETPPDDAGVTEGEAEVKASEEEIDYKAKFESADQELAKAKNDLKSIQAGNKASAARDAKLDTLQVAIEGLQKSQDAQEQGQMALVKALSSGETEGLSAELDTITQDSRAQRAVSRIKVQVQSMQDSLVALGNKGGVDINSDERFADIRGNWNAIINGGGVVSDMPAELGPVIVQMALKMQDITSEKALDEAKTAGATERKKALEDANVLDIDSGGRTGAADGSVTQLIEKFNTGARVTKAEQTRIDEHLEALDDTPGSALG